MLLDPSPPLKKNPKNKNKPNNQKTKKNPSNNTVGKAGR